MAMANWCQRKCWRGKKKKELQFTHVFGCCPRACPQPQCPEAQLTKILVLCWALQTKTLRVRSNGCLLQYSSQDEEVLLAANRYAACAVASFTLSHTKRKRGTVCRLQACFSPLTVFPKFFLLVKLRRQEKESGPGRGGGGTDLRHVAMRQVAMHCLNEGNGFCYDHTA